MMDLDRRWAGITQIAMVCSAAAMLGACAGTTRLANAPDPIGYCYRTLALVDCYTTPEIDRPTIVPPTYRAK